MQVRDRMKAAIARVAAAFRRSHADGAQRVSDAEPRLPLFASGDPRLAERVDAHMTSFGEH